MMGLFSGIKLLGVFFVLFCLERLSKYIKIVPYWLLGCTCIHLGLCRQQYGFFSLSVTVSPWPLIFNLSFIKDAITTYQYLPTKLMPFTSLGILGFTLMHWQVQAWLYLLPVPIHFLRGTVDWITCTIWI